MWTKIYVMMFLIDHFNGNSYFPIEHEPPNEVKAFSLEPLGLLFLTLILLKKFKEFEWK